MNQTRPVLVRNPRYIVQPVNQDDLSQGAMIVDRQGKDKPYTIELPSPDPYSPARTDADTQRSIDHTFNVAGDWCYTWNIVELGYCGSCQSLRSSVSDGKTYPAVGFHSLDKLICFYCACSQE